MATITIIYEEGEIIKIQQLPWMKKFWVGITKSNDFNPVGCVVDFFEKDLELIK